MFKRFAFSAVLLSLIAAAVPAVALTLPTAKPVIDPKIATALATSPTADVIVGFKSAPTDADILELTKQGFTGPFVRYEIVPAVAATATGASLRAILSNSRVSRVEFDEVLDYNLDRATAVARAKPMWTASAQTLAGVVNGFIGRGVTVAVVDSGVDGRHPDLEPALKGNFIMAGRTNGNEVANILDPENFGPSGDLNKTFEANATAIEAPVTDNGGHGTHVAGTVLGRGKSSGGKYKGVAPGAKLVGLSVGEVVNVSRGLAAFDWIHKNRTKYGIKVATNSWGGAGSEALTDSLTYAAVRRLINDDGITVLFSAGNDSGDGTTIETSANCNIPEVICVANYYDRTGYLDTSSSRGLKTNENTWPDLAAPGTQIISTAMLGGGVTYYGTAQDGLIAVLDGSGEPVVVPVPLTSHKTQNVNGTNVVVGDYSSMTGTSMATPVVAGVVALLLEANPALTPAQIKGILRQTATMIPGRSYAADGFELGEGVVDAAEAVAVALRMKDGDTLADAINNASVDFTTTPAKINFGPGPVADQTIPLMPGGAVGPFAATGHIYQQTPVIGIGVFGLTGSERMIGGTEVQIAARSITSSKTSMPIDLNNFSVTFFLMKGNVIKGQYNGVNEPDGTDTVTGAVTDYQSSYNLTVPAGWSGDFKLIGELTYLPTGDVYQLFNIPVTVTSDPAS